MLRDKSKSLHKVAEPRKAYKYVAREADPNDLIEQARTRTLQQFNKMTSPGGSLPASPS